MLACMVEKGDHVTYNWSEEAGTPLLSPTNSSHLLYLTLGPQHANNVYICIASNPISNSSQTFIPWSRCSSRPPESRQWGLYTGLFLGGIVGIIMILQVVILLLRRRDDKIPSSLPLKPMGFIIKSLCSGKEEYNIIQHQCPYSIQKRPDPLPAQDPCTTIYVAATEPVPEPIQDRELVLVIDLHRAFRSLEAAGSDTDIFIVNGILGESATFPLNIQPSQKVTFISWHSKTSVAFVTPGNFGEEPIVTITHQNYHERINVSGQNYNLELRNLKIEDSGIYKADINVETSKTTTTRSYNLQVYRRLGKPKITQSFVTSVNSTCNATLMCSVDKEEKNVTYSWSPRGEAGNVLQIFQTPDNQEETYTCTAWNPVSNNSDSISAQQLCTDITMSPHIHRTGLMSGLAVLSLLIIILSVVLFLLCKKEGSFLNNFSKNPGNSVSEDSSPPLVVNGVLGESVTLPSNFSEKENIMSITWLHKGNSVIFISPKEAKIQVTDPKRKDQLNVTKSYSLQINNLTMADVGHYRAQITTSTSYLNTDYNLQIFRRLSNLQVAHHTKRSENNTCEIQLTCSVENPNDNVSFRWQVAGIPYHSETNLSISWDPKSLSEETYTCIAENPVSFLSSSVSDKSVCEAETVSNLEYASFSSGNTVYAQVTHSNKRKPIYSKTTAHHNVV
ncbi:hypothetical protein MJG53_001540 [Ovis ammon polii x Ovis aries]|uniref:Uncharacterized protein n=1 Tax=Ovis ammon polii x Ovis aries TaxID=2918886 RepID=A0ACB9VKF9_9CETA|nr:hypothetical protein MJG53_001540 [Ovis ammon polii x Ovis aries]